MIYRTRERERDGLAVESNRGGRLDADGGKEEDQEEEGRRWAGEGSEVRLTTRDQEELVRSDKKIGRGRGNEGSGKWTEKE